MSSQKPVLKWTEDEVNVWLRDLGPWTEEELVPAFQNSHIGKVLSLTTRG